MGRKAGPGRRRKSVDEHIANGTYRPGKHGPRPAAGAAPGEPTAPPDKPADLPDTVAAKWDALVGLLGGRLRPVDGPLLVELCRWLARADAAAVQLDGSDKLSPLLFRESTTLAGIATDKVTRLSERFGLTPADRARLGPEPAAGPAKAKVMTRPMTALDKKGRR